MDADRINALRMAVELLDGEGGGYQPHEKYAAKLKLMEMLREEEIKQNTPA